MLLQRGFHRHESLLLLPLALFQILLYFGMQTDSDALIAVESLHRHFVGKVSPDNAVQQFQTFFYGLFLDGCGNQCPHFLFRQVIDHIGLDAFRLHSQRPPFRIHDKTVRGKALRQFLVGKIDRRGYKLLVRPCRFPAARTADHRRDDRLQVLQNVPLLYGLRLLMPLVIESVTARLQLAGLHAPVGTFGYDGRPRKEQLAADPAQVQAPLVAWRPAEERRGHSHPSHATVLADADAVAVQPHSHTPVGIAGMDEVLGHIEVFAHDAREHVVGFLVGRIGSPVRECQHLTFAYRIDQQRRIMPLHNQPIP